MNAHFTAPEEIRVRKGVPIPGGGKNNRYPWDEMQVGDSFLFPRDFTPSRAASTIAARHHKSNGGRFQHRKIMSGSDKGRIGCWRVA
jgi:hypothetical protein